MDQPASLLSKIPSLGLKNGKALDIAMGKGRNAVYLAKLGFEVEGIELSAESIAECKKMAEKEKVQLKITEGDLEKIALPGDRFDLVICFFYLQRDLFPRMKAALKKGGFLFYETFLIDQHEQYGAPRRAEFCFGHNEMLNAFREFRVHYYEEGRGEGDKFTSRIIAQKI